MGPISCPDTLVTNHQCTPREMPEDRRFPYRAAEACNHAWLPLVAAATLPNQPQRCVLTDYFNNYNFRKLNNTLPDDGN